IEELYLLVYSCLPDGAECDIGRELFAEKENSRRQAAEDLLWALLTTPEFMFKDSLMTTHRNCEGFSRRDCIKLGLGGLLSGGLVGALRATASAASSKSAAKACILIWMDGGPSHYETFDPKPEAPIEFRGQFDAIPTKTSGVRFSQHMQRLGSAVDTFPRTLAHLPAQREP